MSIYVDTSAFLAVINPSDNKHSSASRSWINLVKQSQRMVTSQYALVETITLIHSRHGTSGVERFLTDIAPVVEIAWPDVNSHSAAVRAMLAHPGKSGPSLVDCMSFEVIRQRGIKDVFSYDRHFSGRGFKIVG